MPGLPATILRLPATYGPGDPQHRLAGYVRRMDDRRAAIPLGERRATWRWSRGYVENVAEAIALAVAADRAAGRIYNVAEPVAYTEEEWIGRVARAADWNGEVVCVPEQLLPPVLRSPLDYVQQYVVDSTRIRAELGYREVVAEDEALRATVEWERHSGFDPVFDYDAEDEVLAAVSGRRYSA